VLIQNGRTLAHSSSEPAAQAAFPRPVHHPLVLLRAQAQILVDQRDALLTQAALRKGSAACAHVIEQAVTVVRAA